MKADIRIGADVGGTFTDVVLIDGEGRVYTHKVPSTPPDYEKAVLDAIDHLLGSAGSKGREVSQISHGTTVATNAVLERRGAVTALVTTRGFRDVLELRRIRAPQIYDLFFTKPPSLIERALRLEISERMSATGDVLVPLSESELPGLVEKLKAEGVESVAVCLLHAYAFPRHEQLVGEFLRREMPGVPVSLSCEVLPERKEYERTATTAVNAYVRPVMQRYLESMRSGLMEMGIEAPLLIMQSAGGLTPEKDAATRPVFALESGPAAGVLAAALTAEAAGSEGGNIITLDMGGTTAKASIIEGGRLAYSPQYEVGASLSAGSRLLGGAGELIRAPSIDIAEVGAGGGSVAYLDSAGGLRVGPRSAGAAPGPACYGLGGTEPTLTDANVVLGYIRCGELADGEVRIDLESARRAIQDRIATPLGLGLLEAAEGIHRIANARTMRALRSVSTERGRDPRDFLLMAFGGSGPVHAAGLGRELGIDRILVPPMPGLFSALGLLFSGVEHHEVRSCLLSGGTLRAEAIQKIRDDLSIVLLRQFAAEGFQADAVALSGGVDMRFQGQTSEIRIPLEDGPLLEVGLHEVEERFEAEHERLYGHRSDADNPREVLAVRVIGRAGARGLPGTLVTARQGRGSIRDRQAYFGQSGESMLVSVVSREELAQPVEGPLLIDEYDSTTVIPPGARVELDEHGNIQILIRRAHIGESLSVVSL